LLDAAKMLQKFVLQELKQLFVITCIITVGDEAD
jgi:hypothetical protein